MKKPWICCAQVHAENAGGAGGEEAIGDELTGDRHAGLVLAILARVAVEREHGGDAAGAGAARGVDHDEQLHQVLVGRRRGGLDDVDVAAAHVLVDLDESLAVRERGDRRFAERHADVFGNFLGESGVGVAGEDLGGRCYPLPGISRVAGGCWSLGRIAIKLKQ